MCARVAKPLPPSSLLPPVSLLSPPATAGEAGRGGSWAVAAAVTIRGAPLLCVGAWRQCRTGRWQRQVLCRGRAGRRVVRAVVGGGHARAGG